MIITCPACSARYSVDATHLGSDGRMVACANCSHRWHQAPQSDTPPPLRPAPAPVPQAQPQAAGPAAAPPQAAPPPPPAPPPAPPPEPEPQPAYAEPPAAEPEPEPEFEVPEVTEPEPEAPTETAAEPDEEDEADSPDELAERALAIAAEEPPDQSPSQEELDAMFGEPEPLESIVDGDDDDDSTYDDADDIPEPEPIPDVFTAPDFETESAGIPWKRIVVAVIVVMLVGGLGTGLVVARDAIVAMVPGMQGIYNVVGLGEPPVGEGLEIRAVQYERGAQGETEVLTVSGTVVNQTELPVDVPYIQVILRDDAGESLRDETVPPDQALLPGGENFRFRVPLDNPSPLARNIEVLFVPAPMADGAPAP